MSERRAAAAAALLPTPRFYVYESPAHNHAWLRHCERFRMLRSASKGELSRVPSDSAPPSVSEKSPLRPPDPPPN